MDTNTHSNQDFEAMRAEYFRTAHGGFELSLNNMIKNGSTNQHAAMKELLYAEGIEEKTPDIQMWLWNSDLSWQHIESITDNYLGGKEILL